jgi:hypothetical protein
MGSNLTRSVDVCLHLFFVYVVCVGIGLAMGSSPFQEVLPTVYDIEISELIHFEWVQAREPSPSSLKKLKKKITELEEDKGLVYKGSRLLIIRTELS